MLPCCPCLCRQLLILLWPRHPTRWWQRFLHHAPAIFNSSTFCFDFSTAAMIACKESLCLLIRVTLPLKNIVRFCFWFSGVRTVSFWDHDSQLRPSFSHWMFLLVWSFITVSRRKCHYIVRKTPNSTTKSQYHINLISITSHLARNTTKNISHASLFTASHDTLLRDSTTVVM